MLLTEKQSLSSLFAQQRRPWTAMAKTKMIMTTTMTMDYKHTGSYLKIHFYDQRFLRRPQLLLPLNFSDLAVYF